MYAGNTNKRGQTKPDMMSSFYSARTGNAEIHSGPDMVARNVSTFGWAREYLSSGRCIVVVPVCCRNGDEKTGTNEKLCRNDNSHNEIVVTAGRIGQSSRRHVCSLVKTSRDFHSNNRLEHTVRRPSSPFRVSSNRYTSLINCTRNCFSSHETYYRLSFEPEDARRSRTPYRLRKLFDFHPRLPPTGTWPTTPHLEPASNGKGERHETADKFEIKSLWRVCTVFAPYVCGEIKKNLQIHICTT